jgi:hypothetical protein
MNRKLSIILLIFLLFLLSGPACGRSIISGQVIDAENGKPIEKAAIYIYWGKTGSGPPGLAGGVRVEVVEVLSDAKGLFKIPKHSTFFKHYRMAVYKKGYVCWSSEDIFPTYEKRKGFDLEDGMVIKLERFKEKYSKIAHANFTLSSSSDRRGLFEDAIKSEIEIEREFLRKNRRK